MKILRLAGLHYKAAIENMTTLVVQHPGSNYQECLKLIVEKRVLYSNAFSVNMAQLGHEVTEVLVDFEPLQQKWAKEHGIDTDDEDWLLAVTLDQIKAFQPDVLYLQDIYSLPFEIRRTLKDRFRFLKQVVLFKGFPGAFDELEGIDLILACTPGLVKQFSDAGHPNVKLVYHAFDSSIQPPAPIKKSGDAPRFTFVGSTGFGLIGEQHHKRYHTLFQLLEQSPLEIWANESKRQFPWPLEGRPTRKVSRNLLKRMLAIIPAKQIESVLGSNLIPAKLAGKLEEILLEKKAAFLFPKLGERGLTTLVRENTLPPRLRHLAEVYLSEWREFPIYGLQEPVNGDLSIIQTYPQQPLAPLSFLYPTRCHVPVFGEAMYEVLGQSRVSLNMHTDAISGEVGNMRLFEVTGVGGCLLTDMGVNLPDLFEQDKEVAAYSSLPECLEKVRYLLEHPDARDEIAKAGQKRTLSAHTTSHRCQEIDTHIQTLLN